MYILLLYAEIFYCSLQIALLTANCKAFVELWLSGLSAQSGTREVPGSSPVGSYSCEDNFSQLNP